MSKSRAKLDLAPQELSTVVAVMACEIAEKGFPSRKPIKQISKFSSDNMTSHLVELDWLEPAGKDGRTTLYRATRSAWAELEFSHPEAT
jgi:hypothetical protein